MAWNPTPDIAALRDFAEQFDRLIVVAFSIDHADRDRFHITTYGRSATLCKLAAAFGDEIARLVQTGALSVPQTEPEDGASAVSTWVRVRPESSDSVAGEGGSDG